MKPTSEQNQPRRRILSLDGGGIRGVLALAVLERIEQIERDRAGDPTLVLADRFDLFAGTSTGAIIAACLAWRMPVADILTLYRDRGPMMFHRARAWQRLRTRYRAESIAAVFREVFCERDGTPATLGTDRLGAMLLVVMRNATTGSAWPITNNPRAVFNDPARPDCNLDVPLWKLLRASTAAPTFFPPERITLDGQDFTFIDGGITPYNNPALIALLTATLPEYRLSWPSGPDRLSLVSVGTGATRARISAKPTERLNLIDHLSYVPPALMGSISEQQDLVCRVLCRCLYGARLDAELGSLDSAGPIPDDARLATYSRYNPPLTDRLRLDDVRNIDRLEAIGHTYAHEHVRAEHLP